MARQNATHLLHMGEHSKARQDKTRQGRVKQGAAKRSFTWESTYNINNVL
jgi:hypothetical protein